MIRVRNEAEFLKAAVCSIAPLVEHVLLVDNLSDDVTPEIINRLQIRFPDKIEVYEYPHKIARVGQENRKQYDADKTNQSPHLSSNYYNWCLNHCHTEFVLKWDGDMIALAGFAEQMNDWRSSKRPVMTIQGVNVHPDRHHLIRALNNDRQALIAQLGSPGLPRWVTSLTYDYPEPRLFPRKGASYDSQLGWTQRLLSPYTAKEDKHIYRYRPESPSFLHMKFCKADPWSNYSPDLATIIAGNVGIGPKMDAEWRDILEQYGHG